MNAKGYIVIYATYNRNESADALHCGVFRSDYPTEEAAHAAIMEHIRAEIEEDCEGEPEVVDEVMRNCVWSDCKIEVKEEHGGIESVYNVEEMEVRG